jgi:hypothetical protein
VSDREPEFSDKYVGMIAETADERITLSATDDLEPFRARWESLTMLEQRFVVVGLARMIAGIRGLRIE